MLRCDETISSRNPSCVTGPNRSEDPDFNAPPEIASVPSFVQFIASRGYCDGAGPTPASGLSSSTAAKRPTSAAAAGTNGLDAIADEEDEGEAGEGGDASGGKGAAAHGPAWWTALLAEAGSSKGEGGSSRGEGSGTKGEGSSRGETRGEPSHYLCIAVREARNLAVVDFDTKSCTS